MAKRSRTSDGFRHRATLVMLAFMFSIGLSAVAQSPSQPAATSVAAPVFDVATIKLNETGSGSINIDWNEAAFRANNIKLDGLLQNAFGIREDLISGLPGWATSAHYDIVAKAVDTDSAVLKALTDDQQRAMLRQLIVERFRLKTHIEVKQLPVYDLSVAKDGIKFPPSAMNVDSPDCGNMNSSRTNMKATCIPISSFVTFLAYRVSRTVIDKTGLPKTGRYDLHLNYRPEQDGPLSDADAQLPSIFNAVQEQLGLKLESAKGPVETLVIDQIEKPTEN